ncbi:MAG TPA: tetratricopeptide repeat protein [Opitutaceae bacterium]
MANFAPSEPNSPANAPVEPPMEEKLRIFWEKNSRAILGACLVVLFAVLARGAYNYYLRERELSIEGDYREATTPEKQRAFVDQHPDHALAGLALLQLGDEAYSNTKYTEAQSDYRRAAEILKHGPFAGRARLGVAMAKLDGGDRSGEQDLKSIENDALELKPVRAEAAFHLATLAAGEGKNDEAIKQFDQVSSLDPTGSWSQRAQMVRNTLPGASAIPVTPAGVSIHP